MSVSLKWANQDVQIRLRTGCERSRNHSYRVVCMSSRSHSIQGSGSRNPGGCLSRKDCQAVRQGGPVRASEALEGSEDRMSDDS